MFQREKNFTVLPRPSPYPSPRPRPEGPDGGPVSCVEIPGVLDPTAEWVGDGRQRHGEKWGTTWRGGEGTEGIDRTGGVGEGDRGDG